MYRVLDSRKVDPKICREKSMLKEPTLESYPYSTSVQANKNPKQDVMKLMYYKTHNRILVSCICLSPDFIANYGFYVVKIEIDLYRLLLQCASNGKFKFSTNRLEKTCSFQRGTVERFSPVARSRDANLFLSSFSPIRSTAMLPCFCRRLPRSP